MIRKNVVAGARVEEGMTLLEMADLSARCGSRPTSTRRTSPWCAAGQAVEARGGGVAERSFAGKVALVYPQLDTATRTNRVRFAGGQRRSTSCGRACTPRCEIRYAASDAR